MDTSESKPQATPDSEQPEDEPRIIRAGYGAVAMRLPKWYRNRKSGEPLTPEESERLKESFAPLLESINRDYEKRFDRDAMLEALPDDLYDHLAAGNPISQESIADFRAYLADNRPDLLERIDPADVFAGWNYGIWRARNSGGEGPSLPPRAGRPAKAEEGQDGSGEDEAGG